MRLTKRETFLVIALLAAITGYFLFQYVVVPQRAEIAAVEAELSEWEEKKQALAVIDDTMAQLGQRRDDVDQQIQTIGNGYFASLDAQEEAIIVLQELLQASGCSDLEISFEEYQRADVSMKYGGVQQPDLFVQNAQVTYQGSYDNLWALLRSFWNFNKFIRVSGVTLMQDEEADGMLTGDIQLSLYDLSRITSVSDTLVEWSESGTFRRQYPFQGLTGEAFPGTRYVLNLDNEDLNKYVKFSDISGHWAEEAIDKFGSKHWITGDAANRFLPDDPITRGELVMLLDKVFAWDTPDGSVDLTEFSDYSELGQAQSSMEKAFYKGYLKGYFVGFDDGTLRPNAPTSYTEFELVMRRVLEQPDYTWDESALEIQQQTGYRSRGLDDKSASITRGEAVYFLYSLQQS